MLPHPITKYLASRGASGPWSTTGRCTGPYAGAVVIPALAESATLFATLRSLAANPPELLDRFLTLIVVNNKEDAPDTDKDDNRATLELLAAGIPEASRLHVAWVDAASPGLELPAKKGGVGLARKIGFDLALPLLDFSSPEPLLIALDGDTLVQPDYLPALVRHFSISRAGGAVIPFRHQDGGFPDEREAIQCYELFLRSYVLGLVIAGSPYAFHTVGSAMACTASAYVSAGGMNTRTAAEDFYFLQHLQKTAGVAEVSGTIVHPSARASHRVPFGTGKSVARLLDGDHTAARCYRPECFAILQQWLSLVKATLHETGREILCRAEGISPHLESYLHDAGFVDAWEKLRNNNRSENALLAAFHAWFDGLRTLKLIHHLTARFLPRNDADILMPALLEWAGLEPLRNRSAQLALLRSIQNTTAR